jgi:hypothetical protein
MTFGELMHRLTPAIILAALIVLVVAVKRPRLPPLRNPIQGWPTLHVLIALYLMMIGVGVTGALMKKIDCVLAGRVGTSDQELEWIFSPSRAEEIVEDWSGDVAKHIPDVRGAVTYGVMIDTVAFIPFYATLLAIGCFWTAGRFADISPLHGYELALGWGGFVAGALDLVENSGMLLELHLHWYWLAPVTASAATLKWALAILCALSILTLIPSRRRPS